MMGIFTLIIFQPVSDNSRDKFGHILNYSSEIICVIGITNLTGRVVSIIEVAVVGVVVGGVVVLVVMEITEVLVVVSWVIQHFFIDSIGSTREIETCTFNDSY